jgi:transposase
MKTTRKSYPSDVSDTEWEFLAPFLSLMREDAPQREYPLRTMFNALRYVVRACCPWRMMPNDLPPWATVYQQARRWFDAGVFEQVSHELRAIVRIMEDRECQPSAAILDARTMQSTPESGGRAGYDGHKMKNGSKVHIAVDTLWNLLALLSTPATAVPSNVRPSRRLSLSAEPPT